MQKSPTCKFLDHGHSAPKGYGRYCTIVDRTAPIEISESACDECGDFQPKIMSFDAWYAEKYSKSADYENGWLKAQLRDCWNVALAVARRRGMM